MIALAGKTALVTGGSRGIGRAVAILLAQAGADVAVTFRSRSADAESVAREIEAANRRALIAGGDLTERSAVEQIFGRVKREFGQLDIFVANAGVWPAEDVPLRSLGEDRWRATMGANLDAVYYATRAALELMRPGGRVVLVSSTAGQRGEAFHADYAATKGALISLTKSLAIECAPDITVNCLAPGWVDTEMCEPAFAGEGREQVRRTIPLGRIASPEDIAGPIVFLCSDLARHITGEVLNVNGGSVLCG
jgi:3-oxoacyl-[acyl-carrier protein] reductase